MSKTWVKMWDILVIYLPPIGWDLSHTSLSHYTSLKTNTPKLSYFPHISSSLHFYFTFSHSSVADLHLSKTYPYLPLLFFILLEDVVASGCIHSYVSDLMQPHNSLLPSFLVCHWFNRVPLQDAADDTTGKLHETQAFASHGNELPEISCHAVSCSCLRQQLPAPEIFTSFPCILLSKINAFPIFSMLK